MHKNLGRRPPRREPKASEGVNHNALQKPLQDGGNQKNEGIARRPDKTDYVRARRQARVCENINPVLSDDRP